MATISTNFADLLEPSLRKVFYNEYASKETLTAAIFNNAFTNEYLEDPVMQSLVKICRKRGREECQALKKMYQKAYV